MEEEEVFSKERVGEFKPAKAYPISFPCRIDESSRAIHCNSCEIVPGLLAKIEVLEALVKAGRNER